MNRGDFSVFVSLLILVRIILLLVHIPFFFFLQFLCEHIDFPNSESILLRNIQFLGRMRYDIVSQQTISTLKLCTDDCRDDGDDGSDESGIGKIIGVDGGLSNDFSEISNIIVSLFLGILTEMSLGLIVSIGLASELILKIIDLSLDSLKNSGDMVAPWVF